MLKLILIELAKLVVTEKIYLNLFMAIQIGQPWFKGQPWP